MAAKKFTLSLPVGFFGDQKELDIIFTVLQEFVRVHLNRPKKHEMKSILISSLSANNLDPEEIKFILATHDELWDRKTYTAKYVEDKLSAAILTHRFSRLQEEMPDLVDRGRFDEITRKAHTALYLPSSHEISYWEDGIEDKIDRAVSSSRRRIPTGLTHMDDHLQGGLPLGKVGVLIAGTGIGKTSFMCFMAFMSSYFGYNARYYSLELSDVDIEAKWLSYCSGVPQHELPLSPKKVRAGYEQYLKTTKNRNFGDLTIKYSPMKGFSLNDLRADLDMHRARYGSYPAVIYLDYFDLLKLNTSGASKKYEVLEEEMERLRGLAGEYNIAVWTASQSNRSGRDKEIVGVEDVAASYGKMFPLDVVITASQREKDREKNALKLCLAKSRISSAGKMCWVEVDWPTNSIITHDEGWAKAQGLVSTPKSSTKSLFVGP